MKFVEQFRYNDKMKPNKVPNAKHLTVNQVKNSKRIRITRYTTKHTALASQYKLTYLHIYTERCRQNLYSRSTTSAEHFFNPKTHRSVAYRRSFPNCSSSRQPEIILSTRAQSPCKVHESQQPNVRKAQTDRCLWWLMCGI